MPWESDDEEDPDRLEVFTPRGTTRVDANNGFGADKGDAAPDGFLKVS